jgi:SAM-dependent methyltransferase
MAGLQPTSYDELPYDSNAFPSTHPDNLAVVATLCGMRTPPANHCRVLELGCSDGSNLIPMAATLPESRFVGIDSSERQISDGRNVVESLKLPNIELKALSILEIDEAFGQFDYIICHGVFSWVPAPVQDKILEISKRNLAPNGIAYISYNTYPWWHIRGMFRDMMCYHVRDIQDTQARVRNVRTFLKLLKESVADRDTLIGRIYHDEAGSLESMPDSYLYHEHLDGINAPIYFHEFAERAARNGLQYVSESVFNDLYGSMSEELRNKVERLALDRISLEQHLDFVRVRAFRSTLLCHDNIALNPAPSPELFMGFHLTGNAKPLCDDADLFTDAFQEFATGDDTGVRVSDPWAKLAIAYLYEIWPEAASFSKVRQAVSSRMREAGILSPDDDDPRKLASALLQSYSCSLIKAHLHLPRFVLEVSERPQANPLTRLQANQGLSITNAWHCAVQPDVFGREVLSHLDGNRNRPALLAALAEAALHGPLGIYEKDERVQDPSRINEVLADSLERTLQWLANRALLVG